MSVGNKSSSQTWWQRKQDCKNIQWKKKKEVVQNMTELQGHNALINEQVCVLPLTGTIMLNDMLKRQMTDYFLHKNNFCNLK